MRIDIFYTSMTEYFNENDIFILSAYIKHN